MKLFQQLGKLKVYFSNAGFYIAAANFMMLLATFKKVYNVNITAWIIVPVGFFLVMLIGWLDYKVIFRHQIEHSNKMNDLKIQLDRIEKKL